MRKWIVDDGQCSEQFEAADAEEAKAVAEAWLAEGEWGHGGCVVDAAVRSEDGAERFGVEITVPADEDALDEYHVYHQTTGHEHAWKAPHEVVGGVRENPGVWAVTDGTGVSITEVCQCGAYRHTYSDTPETMVEYIWGLWPDASRDNCPAWFRCQRCPTE